MTGIEVSPVCLDHRAAGTMRAVRLGILCGGGPAPGG
jgi:hypothetical protein